MRHIHVIILVCITLVVLSIAPTFGNAQKEPPPKDNPDKPTSGHTAFEAISATVRSGIGLAWTIRAGSVKFTDARTSFLADDPATDWPEQTTLTGFAYERFGSIDQQAGMGVYDARARIAWLRRLQPFDPLPWERAAHVLRSHGDVSGAERLLIAQRRRARLPGVRVGAPEASYLAWLDCRETGLADPYTFFLERAKVALNDGALFGPGGAGFVRLNFGCPRALLRDGLARMQAALARAPREAR